MRKGRQISEEQKAAMLAARIDRADRNRETRGNPIIDIRDKDSSGKPRRLAVFRLDEFNVVVGDPDNDATWHFYGNVRECIGYLIDQHAEDKAREFKSLLLAIEKARTDVLAAIRPECRVAVDVR